jgi:hypothetical protein
MLGPTMDLACFQSSIVKLSTSAFSFASEDLLTANKVASQHKAPKSRYSQMILKYLFIRKKFT